MIWLPVISAILCGVYAALGVKSRLPAWTTVGALAGSFVIAAITVSRLDFTRPVVVHLFDWIDLSWSSGSGEAGDRWHGLRANFALYLDGLSRVLDPLRHLPRHDDRVLRERVHGGGQGHRLLPVLRGRQHLPLRDDRAGARREPRPALPRLGRRRSRQLPAHRLLLQEARSGGGGQEGLHHEPDRRPGPRPRRLPDLARIRQPRLRHPVRRPRSRRHRGRPVRRMGRDAHPLVPDARRLRQVRPVPALRLAARRDGRPDAGLRPDPRRDDGDRGHLPDRPHHAVLPDEQGRRRPRPRGGRVDRRPDRPARRDDRHGPVRHQTGHGVLDRLAAGLHVHGSRPADQFRCLLPRAHARLLQGAALPLLRCGDARLRRPARPSQARRPPARERLEGRLLDDADRQPLARRRPRHRGLLLEGRDPRPGVHRRRRRLPDPRLDRHHHRRPDRVLHLPGVVPGLHRPDPLQARRSPRPRRSRRRPRRRPRLPSARPRPADQPGPADPGRRCDLARRGLLHLRRRLGHPGLGEERDHAVERRHRPAADARRIEPHPVRLSTRTPRCTS